MKSIEVVSKRVKDAIEEGLTQLGVTLSDVDVEILDQGGFLRKARVKLTVTEYGEEAKKKADEEREALKAEESTEEKETPSRKETESGREKTDRPDKKERAARGRERDSGDRRREDRRREEREPYPKKKFVRREQQETEPAEPAPEELKEAAGEYLSELIALMGVKDCEVKISGTVRQLEGELATESSAVIGHRGETLYALEFLTGLIINRGREKYVKLKLDCNGYRLRREDSLGQLALRMAEKAVKSGRKVTLEPMNSAQRRIIHSALAEDERIITKSEGKDPVRRVVIFPRRENRDKSE